MLGVYPNPQEMYDEIFNHLRAGFENNEAILLITDDFTKDEALRIISERCCIEPAKVAEMEGKGEILIKTTEQWYFPEGDTSKLDVVRVMSQWSNAIDSAIKKNKKGLRSAGDMRYFFEHGVGLTKQFVDYESLLDPHMPFPLIGLCAYRSDNIGSLSPNQLKQLHLHHSPQWTSGYSMLKHPQHNQHVAMVYETEEEKRQAVAEYFNDGLAKGQLCVYGSVSVRDCDYLKAIAPLIKDFDRNMVEGNLIMLDMAPHYIAALSGDLEPFEQSRDEIVEKIKGRPNKHVRFVNDCAEFLFENRHFEECAMLERWGQKKPIFGSYLCVYSKHLMDSFPHNMRKQSALHDCHDLIVDSKGRWLSSDSLPGAGK